MVYLDAPSVEPLSILQKHASPLTCQFLIPSPACSVQPAVYVRSCKMYRVCPVQMKEASTGTGAGMCGERGETRAHSYAHLCLPDGSVFCMTTQIQMWWHLADHEGTESLCTFVYSCVLSWVKRFAYKRWCVCVRVCLCIYSPGYFGVNFLLLFVILV